MPALGLSLFLLAVGAILAFAVDYTVTGVDVVAIGVVLMVVGAVGLLLSLLFWTSFAPFGRTGGGHYHDPHDTGEPHVHP
jgi:hypothetical protein